MNNFIYNYANIPNPITKFFNKIHKFWLYRCDNSEEIEWLEDMKKVPLYVKWIKISSKNAEELENLTDPNLHNTPINKLHLAFNNMNISVKTIENIQLIYPNSITLDYNSYYTDESSKKVLFGNFIKLLSKLDHASLKTSFNKNYYRIKLEFSEVICKVVESYNECSYIRAKSVEIRWAGDELCWIK